MGVPFAGAGSGGELWWTPRRGKPRKGWVLPSAEVHHFPAYQEKASIRLEAFVSKEGDLYRRVLSGEGVISGGALHGSALAKMAAMLGMHERALQLPLPPRRPIGLPNDRPEAEQPDSVAAEHHARLIAAARRLLPPPSKRAEPTPARVSVVDRLVRDGRLTTAEADLFVHDGHVTDASWKLVREL